MVAEVSVSYLAKVREPVRDGKKDGKNEDVLRPIPANNLHDLEYRFPSGAFKCSRPRGTIKFAWASDLQGRKNLHCLRLKPLRANYQDIDESIRCN